MTTIQQFTTTDELIARNRALCEELADLRKDIEETMSGLMVELNRIRRTREN